MDHLSSVNRVGGIFDGSGFAAVLEVAFNVGPILPLRKFVFSSNPMGNKSHSGNRSVSPAEVLGKDLRFPLPCFRAFVIDSSAHEKNGADTW